MCMMRMTCITRIPHVTCLTRETFLAMKREVNEPEHVCRCQERREDPHPPQQLMSFNEGLEQDFVLREEAGQERHAGDRHRGNHERPVSDRNVLLQSAHLADVLLAMQGVDHRARSEEQASLEERVRVEV